MYKTMSVWFKKDKAIEFQLTLCGKKDVCVIIRDSEYDGDVSLHFSPEVIPLFIKELNEAYKMMTDVYVAKEEVRVDG